MMELVNRIDNDEDFFLSKKNDEEFFNKFEEETMDLFF